MLNWFNEMVQLTCTMFKNNWSCCIYISFYGETN